MNEQELMFEGWKNDVLSIVNKQLAEYDKRLNLADLNKFPFSTFVIDNLNKTLSLNSGQSLVKNGSFTTDSTITVDGNTDLYYKLFIRAKHSSSFALQLQFNGDTSTNYKVLKHDYGRIAGSDVNQIANINNDTKIDLSALSKNEWFGELTIDAKSGYVRGVNARFSSFTDNNNETGSNVTAFWNNTADNLTSIKIITGTITEGSYFLYKINA